MSKYHYSDCQITCVSNVEFNLVYLSHIIIQGESLFKYTPFLSCKYHHYYIKLCTLCILCILYILSYSPHVLYIKLPVTVIVVISASFAFCTIALFCLTVYICYCCFLYSMCVYIYIYVHICTQQFNVYVYLIELVVLVLNCM